MEKELSQHKWIVGEGFSLADASLSPYFQTLFQFDWTALFRKDCEHVTRWYERCVNRHSYQTGVAADFDDALLTKLQSDGAAVWEKIAAHLE